MKILPALAPALLFAALTLTAAACCAQPFFADCWICREERMWAEMEAMEEAVEAPPEEGDAPVATWVVPTPPPAAGPEAFARATVDDRFDGEMEQGIVALTNVAREDNGEAPLAGNERLAAAARQHSREMCELRYFSHTSPVKGLETIGDRARKAGIRYSWLGENIAMTSVASDAAFVEMWMSSDGHRKNILKPEFTHIGVGVWNCNGSRYATQLFGTLR